jgi:ParB family chromosome partitioning protein
MNAKRGLGRGLASLIPEGDEGEGLQEVPHGQIVPNPHQPRTPIDPEDLKELAASIEEHGVIQPLVVTRRPEGGYQLIAGERRWRASRLAGLETVPVIVKEAVPQQMLELALVENVQRSDLNPLEEATAYRQLVEEFGLSQSEVARRVGKSRAAVANTLRLLGAAPTVQRALMEEEISAGHARALLGLETQGEQAAALKLVVQKGLNVRQTEALVKGWKEEETPPKERPEATQKALTPEERALEERFREALGTRVRLRTGKKGGRVVIYYYSDEEFRALYEHLTGEGL